MANKKTAQQRGLYLNKQFGNPMVASEKVQVYVRTSDSLNEGLPIKMTREKFQRK